MRRPFVSIGAIVFALVFGVSVAFGATRWGKAITFTASSTSTASVSTTMLSSSVTLLDAPFAATDGGGKGSGSCAAPCTGLRLTASSLLTGLGSADAVNTIQASGTPEVTCTTKGGNQARGQNPPSVTVTGRQVVGTSQISRNGTADLLVSGTLPAELLRPLPGAAWGCPNDNWAAQITAVKFTTATITVSQKGAVTLQDTFVLQ